MIPESKLILGETTIREMSITNEVRMTKKSMIRWLALSLGLISPNESRTLIFDVLEIIFYAHIRGEKLSSAQIFERLKSKNQVSEKAVYYHLLRLKERGLLKSRGGLYFLSEDDRPLPEVLKSIYDERLRRAFEKISILSSSLENSIK